MQLVCSGKVIDQRVNGILATVKLQAFCGEVIGSGRRSPGTNRALFDSYR